MAEKPSIPIRNITGYLGAIEKIVGKKRCVYRGQPDANWALRNSAERRLLHTLNPKHNGGAKLSKNEQSVLYVENIVDYHENLLEEAELKGFRRIGGRKLTDLELLAELRHFEAATCLLDFTNRALVALYFACKGEERKKGKVFILHHQNIPTILPGEEKKIDKLLNEDEAKLWRPIMQGQAERRIICQSGLFLINLTEPNKNLLTSITINFSHKNKILDELNSRYQISADTLFIDLSGFAQNQASKMDVTNYLISFYKGNAKRRLGQHKEAVSNYDEAIRLRPDFARAYNNRGIAKRKLGQPREAIKDYNRAIRLNSDYIAAYNNRGVAKRELKQYEEAISDHTKTIELKPDWAKAHYNLGKSRYLQGNKEQEALADLKHAISLPKEDKDLWINEAAQEIIDEIEKSLKSSEEK